MSVSESKSTEFAIRFLSALIAQGVRDIVVCPGSRSQALALAAAEAEQAGVIRLHVRIDERSAAFFALGLARETGMPAGVVVTSGTAVANLMPAVLEAHEGRVPLILLTADRPAELLGSRSNQTTRQAHLFGRFARLSLDVNVDQFTVSTDTDVPSDATLGATNLSSASQSFASHSAADAHTIATEAVRAALGAAAAPPSGPVQVNLQFREPLSGAFPGAIEYFAEAETAPDTEEHECAHPSLRTFVLEGDALTVVVAGQDAGVAAEEFAYAAGLPLLAEVVSGARFGRNAIAHYAELINTEDVGALTERAIVFGHPTLTRAVVQLLSRNDVEVCVIDPHEGTNVDHYNPAGNAKVFQQATIAESYAAQSMRRWLGAWVRADMALREKHSTIHEPDVKAALAEGYKDRNAYARAELEAMREPISRQLLTDSVWRATWPHDRLVLAASRLVRVLDGIAHPRKIPVHANRGLAGIDGTIAMSLGVASASQDHDNLTQAAGVTRVLLGDLALLHDVGSLTLTPGEERPRIQLFVANDGGGSIFDTLEAAHTAEAQAFDRVMFTPHTVKLRHLAEAYGWAYRTVTTRNELETLLTEQVTGPELVEVPIAR